MRTRLHFLSRLVSVALCGLSSLAVLACMSLWVFSYIRPDHRNLLHFGTSWIRLDWQSGWLEVTYYSQVRNVPFAPTGAWPTIPAEYRRVVSADLLVLSYRAQHVVSSSGILFFTRSMTVPLWVLVSISMIVPFGALIQHVRARQERSRRQRGLCPRCGYDIRATRSRCPECGGRITRSGA